MDRPDTIQFLLTAHEIDASKAVALKPPNGVVIVEMLPETKQIGMILLPEVAQGKFRPDVGIVIAVGPDVNLALGSTVCVRAYDGQWIEDFDAGYKTKNQVRIYGTAARLKGAIQAMHWSESIPLQIVFYDDGEPDLVATNNNIVIKRDPIIESESGFLLPELSKYRNGLATVLSIGPNCDVVTCDGPLQVGDRISYNSQGELDFAFGDDKDLAIIPDIAINCVIAL